jgi:hypothetical protein
MRERLFRAQSFVIFVYDRAKMKVPACAHIYTLSPICLLASNKPTYPLQRRVFASGTFLTRVQHQTCAKQRQFPNFDHCAVAKLTLGDFEEETMLRWRAVHRKSTFFSLFCSVSGVVEKDRKMKLRERLCERGNYFCDATVASGLIYGREFICSAFTPHFSQCRQNIRVHQGTKDSKKATPSFKPMDLLILQCLTTPIKIHT